MVTKKCETCGHETVFESNPTQWSCHNCNYINDYNNSELMNRETASVIAEVGRKDDSGKLRYSLIPHNAMKALAEVLTFAVEEKGYIPHSWRTVPNREERYTDALMRHVEAYRSGEFIDPESGIHHMGHVLANASFLLEFYYEQEI